MRRKAGCQPTYDLIGCSLPNPFLEATSAALKADLWFASQWKAEGPGTK